MQKSNEKRELSGSPQFFSEECLLKGLKVRVIYALVVDAFLPVLHTAHCSTTFLRFQHAPDPTWAACVWDGNAMAVPTSGVGATLVSTGVAAVGRFALAADLVLMADALLVDTVLDISIAAFM